MGTRLFVNSIPKYVDTNRLREHFAKQGDVTDVKVMRTRDGKSRCFGFVGYKTVEQAQAAQKYFHKTFMDTSRLDVKMAETYKRTTDANEDTQNNNAQPGHDDEMFASLATKGKRSRQDALQERAAADPKLAEFLNLMKPRSTAKTYANDEIAPAKAEAAGCDVDPTVAAMALGSQAPSKHKKRKRAAQESGSDTAQPATSGSAERRGSDADTLDRHDIADEAISDFEYMKRRMRKLDDDDGSSVADKPGSAAQYVSAAQADSKEDSEKQRRAHESKTGAELTDAEHGASAAADMSAGQGRPALGSAEAVAAIAETKRLFLRNLPFVATDEDILQLCMPFGAVTDATVVKSKATGTSKGFAVVTYAAAQDAVSAYQALDGSIFQGRLMHVLPGRPLGPVPAPAAAPASQSATANAPQHIEVDHAAGGNADGADAGAASAQAAPSFKAVREAQRKSEAGNRKAWSTLYMRDDTVAEAAAAIMGVSKVELMGAEAASAAVQLALAEAQVLATTKAELAEAGVSVAALEAAAAASGAAAADTAMPRSDTVLLVKNLPYSATEEALRELAAKYGGAVRLVLPSTRALALLELPDKQAARAAFRGLAYKRFQHVPLYLEYAPRGIFTPDAAEAAPAPATRKVPVAIGTATAQVSGAAELRSDADDASASTASLYVKNVAFSTTQDSLRALFDQAAAASGGMLRAVRTVMHTRPDGKQVPKGFAFAEFDAQDTANAVLRRLQGRTLDGHALQLELSAKKGATTSASKVKAKDSGSDTKVLVRNLAFEASAKDVRSLMEAFGAVKTCRLPKKFDGGKRGFAFVEFADKGDARNAVRHVQGTHLYGRRLLLEYAQAEEGVAELRAKTAAQLRGQPA